MTKRHERVHLTLFVPGTPPDLETWRRALGSQGLSLGQGELSGAALPFVAGAEWVENPRDGSFGKAFSYGTASTAQAAEIDASPGALLLSIPVDLHRERRAIAGLAHMLKASGALAIRVEESKLGFPVGRWIELIDGTDPWSLYRAVVVILVDEDQVSSCGMHVFSLPDAQVALDDKLKAPEANELLGVLNVFQIAEDPVLASGHTFSTSADSPRHVLRWWPDATYPANHVCHNPFGVWRLAPSPGPAAPASDLAFVFMPALVVILTAAQAEAGRPLTRDEVEQMTANATCMTMQHRDARAMERSRGYADIDPERAWEQWQALRGGMGGYRQE